MEFVYIGLCFTDSMGLNVTCDCGCTTNSHLPAVIGQAFNCLFCEFQTMGNASLASYLGLMDRYWPSAYTLIVAANLQLSILLL